MAYNIVLTTAEDIVAVIDAVIARGKSANVEYIAEFTEIATGDQVDKAIRMAVELGMLIYNDASGCYTANSFLAERLVTAASDDQKAAIMRLILEQYEPYKTFKTRYGFTHSIDVACRQAKTLCSIVGNERDIKNTLISIATYAKALKSEGANLYSFVKEKNIFSLIETALSECEVSEKLLREFFGDNLYSKINSTTVIKPLEEAFQKSKADSPDTRAVVVYAANAFESFLDDYASAKGISLAGQNGIIQKKNTLAGDLSKKHKGMIEYIGQVRNAADHGADNDENGQMWTITRDTALLYPCIVATVIRNILQRENGSIEV